MDEYETLFNSLRRIDIGILTDIFLKNGIFVTFALQSFHRINTEDEIRIAEQISLENGWTLKEWINEYYGK